MKNLSFILFVISITLLNIEAYQKHDQDQIKLFNSLLKTMIDNAVRNRLNDLIRHSSNTKSNIEDNFFVR